MQPSAQVGFRRGVRWVLHGFLASVLLASIAPASAAAASFAFLRSGAASNDSGATTLTVQLTGVAAGDLIVAYVKYEGAATTVAVSDGASTFAADTAVHAANGDLHGQFFYALAAQASGTVTYTATWAASKPYRKLFVYEYSHSGTVATFDVSGRATATSGTLNSGAVTTTGTDEVVFGSYGEYSANTTSNEQIGGRPPTRCVVRPTRRCGARPLRARSRGRQPPPATARPGSATSSPSRARARPRPCLRASPSRRRPQAPRCRGPYR